MRNGFRALAGGVVTVALLAGCGGGHRAAPGPGRVVIADGPIARACMASNRKAANRTVCGCVQGVANQTLGGADQSRAVRLFRDPDLAEKHRMDTGNTFWTRYKAFASAAETTCQGV